MAGTGSSGQNDGYQIQGKPSASLLLICRIRQAACPPAKPSAPLLLICRIRQAACPPAKPSAPLLLICFVQYAQKSPLIFVRFVIDFFVRKW
ncbi:MAG: hypothetical protein FWG83_06830 [Oscillospiraceae bacterium]|nr:hypothetical protein [Oscillospiraceae bacterium]